ncbi:MAG: hypothetical protein ACMVP2_04185 [Imperialibacter sp.]|uniref:hypothetical protein n=1 Tax=Imperialibacter sp. TaxID=2038411 RepID=UPI0030D7D5F7|tara:strand:- start:2057 stop:3247 length:1191 start_codon:yes stop_codon:yes gene_type:complete
MGGLNKEQLQAIRDYLARQGMTYKPLQDEMLDHVSCDIEKLIAFGQSFDAAWLAITKELPPKQIQTIQLETMETMNKRESLSKWFAYLSFFLLFAGSVFKLMKFPGAGQMLIGSFIAIALALISGSTFGMIANKEKRGAWLLVAILVGVLLFLASFTFQILHLPGAIELRTMAVVALCLSYSISFFYLRGNENYLLPWLHERYTPAIERFIFILFAAVFVLRMPSLTLGYEDFVSRILLVITIASAGLHFHAISWQYLKAEEKPGVIFSLGLSFSLIVFMLPALVDFLDINARGVLTVLFWPVAGFIATHMGVENGKQKAISLAATAFITAVSSVWALVAAGFFVTAANGWVFNGFVLAALLSLSVFFRQNRFFRMYMLVVISHYLFVYPWELGLW